MHLNCPYCIMICPAFHVLVQSCCYHLKVNLFMGFILVLQLIYMQMYVRLGYLSLIYADERDLGSSVLSVCISL